MHHHIDLYESEDEYTNDDYFSEKTRKSKNRQRKDSRTRRKLEDLLEARRIRKLLDDFKDY
jgi:transposase